MGMKNLFLNAKHWQIFIPIFILPFGFQFIFMGSIMPSPNFDGQPPEMPDMQVFQNFLQWLPLLIAASTFIQFGWIWSVASGLKEMVPGEAKLKYKRFQWLFAIPAVYIALLVAALAYFLSTLMPDLLANKFNPSEEEIGSFVAIFFGVFFLHLLAIGCIFYCIWHVAKSIKCAEVQRDVRGSELAGYFFLTWLLPVGIWFLQPVINKLYQYGPEAIDDEAL